MATRQTKKTHRTCSDELLTSSVLESATFESFDDDPDLGVLRNVKLLGTKSKNGRFFTEKALNDAASLYEGLVVNDGHGQKPGETRIPSKGFGFVRNPRVMAGEGVFGDVHFRLSSEPGKQMVFEHRHNKKASGFSHDATYNMTKKRYQDGHRVEGVTDARFVDWVRRPATTNGMNEGTEEPDMADEITYTASELEAEVAKRVKESAEQSDVSKRLDAMEQTLKKKDAHIATLESEKQAAERQAVISKELEGVELGAATRKAYDAIESADDRAEFLKELKEAVQATESVSSPSPSPSPSPFQIHKAAAQAQVDDPFAKYAKKRA